MANFKGVNLLELVECYAIENDLPSCEEDLSERFDNDVMPSILETHGEPGISFEDTDMATQAFNDWADGLCKDGEIHDEQYSNYAYVGEWS